MPERAPWGKVKTAIASLVGTLALTQGASAEARMGLLEQPTRKRILGVIQHRPGIKISNLCKETGAGWGTVKHHLYLLEKAGLVVPRSTGRDCLLFPSDFPVENLAATEALCHGRAGHLATAIAESPGASQRELCTRLNMTRKIIRRYVELLASAGLVSERREARFQRYYPNPKLQGFLHEHEGPETPSESGLAAPVVPAAPAALDGR